ncbi:hypothetical protein SU69_08395 [Thermosipho melanesiensis]|uniref:Uncharacterized protein n=2 Tax=Thermosipho melanesiensis TaxID=46541 RepID=A6LNJ7_THEM4|nr:hypothetical protein [Thermosipho melanesiensis]ABR31498.1 hypothetical protein Tmel_1654 [Thermosipho melanesiensis BI429]APT74931.1 hypothetical protein BW47_08760 [Thermosipho melanesiensis]OOC35467.1 hypothetical protein SU69_08395 [Thermosipho melanesiensis]OOC36504.1 hypothetical protein SU68_08460 [Thermosipho melanesiensis]OOC36827.1 hypothetical protein SU70_08405 [Thermosipho melanesiensis]
MKKDFMRYLKLYIIMSYGWSDNTKTLVLGYVPVDFIANKNNYNLEVCTQSTHIKDLFFENSA